MQIWNPWPAALKPCLTSSPCPFPFCVHSGNPEDKPLQEFDFPSVWRLLPHQINSAEVVFARQPPPPPYLLLIPHQHRNVLPWNEPRVASRKPHNHPSADSCPPPTPLSLNPSPRWAPSWLRPLPPPSAAARRWWWRGGIRSPSIYFPCEFNAETKKWIYQQKHAGLTRLLTKNFCFQTNVSDQHGRSGGVFMAQWLSNDVTTLVSAAAEGHLDDVWNRQAVTVRLQFPPARGQIWSLGVSISSTRSCIIIRRLMPSETHNVEAVMTSLCQNCLLENGSTNVHSNNHGVMGEIKRGSSEVIRPTWSPLNNRRWRASRFREHLIQCNVNSRNSAPQRDWNVQ